MERNNTTTWLTTKDKRKRMLLLMKLPLTAKQMSPKLNISPSGSSQLLSDFAARGLAVCLNPTARNSRLYHLTSFGKVCQKKLCQELNRPQKKFELPAVDWNLYGWVCFSHRSAIVAILTEPMQPSEMKRHIWRRNSKIKISANNIRDSIKLFEKKGIVEKVTVKKKAHPRYELTQAGKQLQKLLLMEKACY